MDRLSLLLDYAFRLLIRNERGIESKVRDSLLGAFKAASGEIQILYDKYSTKGRISIIELASEKRYAKFEREILGIVTPIIRKNVDDIKEYLPFQYKDAYLRAIYSAEKTFGKHFSVKLPSESSISIKFSTNNPKNFYMAESLRNYPIEAQRAVRRAIMNGLSMGKSQSAMANDIKKVLRVVYNKALLIIRTESMGAVNQGANDAYNKLLKKGVEGKLVWRSIIDEKTRPTKRSQIADHRIMDGQVKDETGHFHLDSTNEKAPYPAWEGLSPEQRCNCRCHEELVLNSSVRAEDKSISNLTYENWKAIYYPEGV